ncbi:alpha/beta hydrolase [Blastococcus sp. CT_GayMR16]|uniref:alpha/beta hydrolase n=1 Tax=Blastococcus sp. CT_GayMR16 TaxID=2559607 RepID=UPI0010749E99|nr:alpha/beta hydrolase [Blastococcus sp. CT_GayMR16]TFV90557.1 hypothetical protein E4P38_03820 [Blastococcus sp. CT_GayMR16]
MTTPLAHGPRVHAIAAWDVPLTRRAVVSLAETIERLLAWKARLEGVGRAIESGDCWSGPAAQSAATALAETSAVSAAVGRALDESLSAYHRLAAQAELAQDLATQALSSIRLLADGEAAPAAVLAEAALGHAASAAAAAESAGDALAGLGVVTAFASLGFVDAVAPADFWDLMGHVPVMGPIQAPDLPSPRPPAEIATWWAGLSVAAQHALIAVSPAAVGALDGVPAWARDRANRRVLDRALRDPTIPAAQASTAGVVARRIAAEEAAGRQVQLHLLDLAGDRVALAVGDLDTADAVALLVPGIANTPGKSLGELVTRARRISEAATASDAGTTVATMVWLGYNPPSGVIGLSRGPAEQGGTALAAALDGLAAARTATATGTPRTTVVAHSYGTVVVDEAADAPGMLDADALALLGSPIMEDDAASLEVPEVFDAASSGDPVVRIPFGNTESDSYGSTALPVTGDMGHSDYFEEDYPTLAAIGEVVTGRRNPE